MSTALGLWSLTHPAAVAVAVAAYPGYPDTFVIVWSQDGGAILTFGGPVAIKDCSFSGNTAVCLAQIYCPCKRQGMGFGA